jgi:hypothetical protein
MLAVVSQEELQEDECDTAQSLGASYLLHLC